MQTIEKAAIRKRYGGVNLRTRVKQLEDDGFEEIDSGLRARVYAKMHSDRVLKIFQDDAAYVAFLQAMPNHPCFPRIHGITAVMTDYGPHLPEYWEVEIERLESLEDVLDGTDGDILSDELENFMIGLEDEPPTGTGDFRFGALEIDALHLLRAMAERELSDFNPDLHTANMMLRGNTVVFIDPFYGQKRRQTFDSADEIRLTPSERPAGLPGA